MKETSFEHAIRIIRHYRSSLGFWGVVVFIISKLCGIKPHFRKRISGLAHPVFVRVGTTDVTVLRQVLLERHYDSPLPFVPQVIVDAGANIGLSAVFFANKYPNATVIAIEPEASNFELLKRNTASYMNVRPLRAALSADDKDLLMFDGGGKDRFRVIAEAVSSVPTQLDRAPMCRVQGLTIETLMRDLHLKRIDLLKMDIEGSERDVFRNSGAWIEKVCGIMVELHDPIAPGCSEAFSDATRGFVTRLERGEIQMCFRDLSVWRSGIPCDPS